MSLEERMDRLERQNRRLKQWLIGFPVVFGLTFVLGAQIILPFRPGPLTADNIRVHNGCMTFFDHQGHERIHLGLVGGEPEFSFLDSQGHPMVTLGAFGQDYALEFWRSPRRDIAHKTPVIRLAIERNLTDLTFVGHTGSIRFGVGPASKGTGAHFFDPAGKEIGALSIENGRLTLTNASIEQLVRTKP